MMRMHSFILLLSALFSNSTLAAKADEKQELIRIHLTDKGSAPIVGELLEETEKGIVVYDLNGSRARELTLASIQQITRGISEKSAAAGVGLSSFIAWKVQKAIPLASASGKIAKIDLATVYVNLGSVNGLESGQELSVYRGSNEVRDPDTNQVLDRARRLIGRLKVVEVREKVSKCTLVGEFEVQYRVGDEVESKTKTAIAVLPLSDSSANPIDVGNALAEEVTSGLVAAGVPLVERTRLADALAELAIQQAELFSRESAQKLGQQVGATAVLIGSLTDHGRTFKANIRLVRVSTGEILFSHVHVIPSSKMPISKDDATGTDTPIAAGIRRGDLLTAATFEKSTRKGNWKFEDGHFHFTGNPGDGMLIVPNQLPKRFRLTLKVRPTGVGKSTLIALYFRNGADFIVQLAADGSCVIVDGKDPRGDGTAKYAPVFVDSKLNTVVYEVRDGVIIVTVNGRQFLLHRDQRIGKAPSNEFSIGVLGEWTFESIGVSSK